jgi:hypothetical protein
MIISYRTIIRFGGVANKNAEENTAEERMTDSSKLNEFIIYDE